MIVISWLIASVIWLENFLFNHGKSSNAEKNSHCVVQNICCQVPYARITLYISWQFDWDDNVDNMCQKLRGSLFRGIHEPYFPSSFRLFRVSFVDKNTKGEKTKGQLNNNPCESYKFTRHCFVFLCHCYILSILSDFK